MRCSAAAVCDRLRLDLPLSAVEEVFGEFQKRGLMLLDDSLALALALPAVPNR